ncbi:MAG: cytochrome c biogenesis protein ResB [Planctomycetota bacterium]|nr:cytochrome c biogenesis protein ResB [Planctomycetota bacterium]
MSQTETSAKPRTLPPRPTKAPKSVGTRILDFLGSYALAMVILTMLLVLTFLGTLEQRHRGIFDVQKDYFESFFHVCDTLGFPIPLIGAVPLLALLFVNLTVGGMIRLRKGRGTIGILVAHLGIALLLIGSLVEHSLSTNGNMSLRPGETSNTFRSYYDWDVVVTEFAKDGSGERYVMPHERYADMSDGERVTFQSERLPFDLVLSGYQRNSVPRRAPGAGGIDGYLLQELEPEEKAEYNRPGVLATLVADGQRDEQILLWGMQTGPHLFEREGRQFGIDMVRKEWVIPFTLKLDRFVKDDHPGLAMAREYSSYVQKIEDGTAQSIHITMNEPLRHRGHIFYQSGYDDIGRDRNGEIIYRTVLAVSVNPADKIPEISCYVIALGLLIHFLMKLFRYIKSENRRQRHAAAA